MEPIRLCCFQSHVGSVCPDGKVMCCYCFDRVDQDNLAVDEQDGTKWDVCIPCWNYEQDRINGF